MESFRHFLSLACSIVLVNVVSCSVGPVFINPAAPTQTSQTAPITNQENYVTQTVYGFLDFTTTIGNTVMVFSPQSASAAAVKESLKANEVVNVIDTTPNIIKDINILPSKTQTSNENKISQSIKDISSIVQAVSPVSSKLEIKSSPLTKINVIEGKSSEINIVKPNTLNPSISSQVHVLEASSSKDNSPASKNIISKIEIIGPSQPVSIVSSTVEVIENVKQTPLLSSIVEVKSEEEPAVIIGNNIGEPEYDFLSRQPSEVVEETYKVINLKPSSKFHLKPRPSADVKNKAAAAAAVTKRADSSHPTGLVTKLGGTVVKDGTTTVHETSVIGTYISGKYAQVLQSTSHIYNHPKGGKINPSPTLRILKTAAPSLSKGNKHHRHLEPTPAGGSIDESASISAEYNSQQNSIKSTRKPSGSGSGYKQRFKNRQKEPEDESSNSSSGSEQEAAPQPSYKKKNRSQSRNSKQNTSHRPQKFGRNSRKSTTSSSVHSEEATSAPPPSKRYQSRKNRNRSNGSVSSSSSENTSSSGGFSRRGYKPRVQTSTVEQVSATTSLYKFKLNRSPGRWQYKTTPKPRIAIRKQNEDAIANNETLGGTTLSSLEDVSSPAQDNSAAVLTPQARSDDVDGLEGSESIASIIDDESSKENKLDTPAFPIETIKVEISTPPDFKDIYYEIATIKSPYTFQIGSVKNTRYITVTSTFEKSLVNSQEATISATAAATEPLTENILATSSNYAKDNNFLDSSVATLPPIYLASDMETPPLETLTETFSTTQTMLKTHILPVVRNGSDTTSSTLVQTYLVTRLVTATKTLPPMEAYQFIPSKTLNEFNSHLDEAGSELHLELEFGDQNEQDDGSQTKRVFPPDLDLANIGSDFDLSDVDKSKKLDGHLRLKKAHAPSQFNKPLANDLIQQQQQQPNLNPDQLQQLALLRLLNPAAAGAAQAQVITTSKPIIKIETLYESHIIPVTQGQNTILSTISKIKGTVTKTDFEFGTSTIVPALPAIPPVPINPINPINPLNPLFPQAQPQFAVTSSPVVQSTVVTQTDSKILKLTFGAKTAYTTVYSTKVVPTVVTTYMTASVPVQPTAAYPGFFPAPYPAFPFVG